LTSVTFKQNSPTGWEAEREPFQFQVRQDEDQYVIDVYDARDGAAYAAYRSTHACFTWQQVEKFCRNYGTPVR
jgi:hypothetical protein